MNRNLTLALPIIVIAAFFGCKHDPQLGTPRVCSTDTTYFVQEVLPIFQSSCAVPGCHDAQNAEEGIILDSYVNIINTGGIEAFDLDAGKVYELITETDIGDRMPRAPFGALSDEQIATIETWIMQGAMNSSCETVGCNEGEVTFSGDIQPLIENRCKGCHNGDDAISNVELETFADIQALALSGAMMGVLNEDDGFVGMPFNAFPMGDCQIEMIQKWIDNGAPND